MKLSPSTQAATGSWSYEWEGKEIPAETVICPLLYGKTWAYTIEIDDNPVSITDYSVDFFAGYEFTDAPPGVSGGQPHPVVGSAAIFTYVIGANHSYMDRDKILEMIKKGWGVANHSYWHKGATWSKPPEILTADEIRNDLFWSQTILGQDFGNGRAPSHFVYPNGYKGYRGHFTEFGIVSGSAVGGVNRTILTDPHIPLDNIGRINLDEGNWKNSGKDDPLFGLPVETGPEQNLMHIDFTHGTDSKPESANAQRWGQRMEHLQSTWGKDGDDSFWSDTVQNIISYRRAAESANLSISPGKLTIELPQDVSGSRLTVRLEGIPETTPMQAPAGGLLYRQGTTVWVTSPMIGEPGIPLPNPSIKRLYAGSIPHTFDTPVSVAGVQVKHAGGGAKGVPIEVFLTLEDGTETTLGPWIIEKDWSNGNILFPILPLNQPLKVRSIKVTDHPIIQSVDVWGIENKSQDL